MKSGRLFALAALMGCAMPAHAAVTFTGEFAVGGSTTDLSGLGAALGANRLSFGSDLVYDSATDLFYGITDRGPGGGVLSFAPRVNVFSLATNSATNAITGFTLQETIVFKRNGVAFDGLNPLLLNGNASVLGQSFDPEGFVRRANGNMLVSDEYGPSVYEFDAAGNFVRAFTTPANLVPKNANGDTDYVAGRTATAPALPIVNGRQDNRGFEGLTLSPDGTKAYAIMQDPLVNEGSQNDGRRSRNLRIVEFDVASGTATKQFAYVLESLADINARVPNNTFGATAQGRNIGVSSITALADGSFLVIERDNRGLGVDDPTGANPVSTKRVYRIRLDGATDVSNVSFAGSNDLPAGVIAVSKALYVDVQAALAAAGLNPLEKIEGLSFGKPLADGTLTMFLVTDNDFSVTQTGAGTQLDVCTSGPGGSSTQIALGDPCPTGQALIPSLIYGFTVDGAQAVGVNPVPEPSTWAMMIAGFGIIGGALRTCRKAAFA
ncbi:MAG: esterase-like activity of phytase family protein [Sphingomonadaceae bacterium]